MKLQINFKTPDATYYPLKEFKQDHTPEELESMENLIKRFVKYDEYVKIEFDTQSQTAKVIQLNP